MLDKERHEEERAREDDTQVLSVGGVSDPGGDEPGTTAWFWCLPGAHLSQTPQDPQGQGSSGKRDGFPAGEAWTLLEGAGCWREEIGFDREASFCSSTAKSRSSQRFALCD